MLWQLDPDKCTECGNCATKCVLTPSAVKCVHAFDVCGYCQLCGGFHQPNTRILDTAAERQLCPTGAIQPLSLADKRQTVIGTAYIDESRCIPWADQKPCIVCEEMCPVPRKAIVLDAIQVTDKQGVSLTVKRPRVERERCIGCGICETRCPLPRQSAIRVYAPAASPRERDAST